MLQTDFSTAANGIEKAMYERCHNRAMNYEDFARNTTKIMQRLTEFPAITSYLKDKNFDINLIEKLFPKSKNEFITLEGNIQLRRVKEDGKKDGDNEADNKFNYFRIFQGTLFFGLKDGKT